MKRLIAIVVSLIVLSVGALPVAAQSRDRCVNRRVASSRDYDRNDTRNYRNRDAYRYDRSSRHEDYRYEDYRDDRSVWSRHRDKITTAAGAGGGAVVGGLIGGKKGAIIGAITGGAGAALYTYKIRNKNRRY